MVNSWVKPWKPACAEIVGRNWDLADRVAHEAAVYQLLGQRGDRITDYLPTVWEYDTIGQVLILGKVSGDRDLRGHQARTGRPDCSLAPDESTKFTGSP